MPRGLVQIEENRCKGCGLCVDACPPKILHLSRSRFNAIGYRPVEVTDIKNCTGCAVCAVMCPDVVFRVFREKKHAKQNL